MHGQSKVQKKHIYIYIYIYYSVYYVWMLHILCCWTFFIIVVLYSMMPWIVSQTDANFYPEQNEMEPTIFTLHRFRFRLCQKM